MPETIFWVILILPLTAFVLAGISALNQQLKRQIPEWNPSYPSQFGPVADQFCGPRLASTPVDHCAGGGVCAVGGEFDRHDRGTGAAAGDCAAPAL